LLPKRSPTFGGLARFCAAALVLSLPGSSLLGGRAHASDTLEERKLPMHFSWHDVRRDEQTTACIPGCRGWIAAVGTITAETLKQFEDFADGRDLKGATIVLDSSGGSVLDAIALGRRWRDLGVATTVGIMTETQTAGGVTSAIFPDAYCESMCVFLLLSGKTRSVPDGAHVRVHQIWMGDRADDAKAASYTSQDVMIIERDVGRLAKYTFDMGGTGDLLALALGVPPWEPLHELTPSELRLSNLVSDDAVAEAQPRATHPAAVHSGEKPIQERFAVGPAIADPPSGSVKSTKTAEALAPSGSATPSQHR
jgi:hypothetical protein